jgi:hypothetical protein
MFLVEIPAAESLYKLLGAEVFRVYRIPWKSEVLPPVRKSPVLAGQKMARGEERA